MPNPNHQRLNRNLVNQRGSSSGSNTGAPTSITCNVCHRKKPQSSFAGRQLGKFTSYNKAFVRDPGSVKVTCKDCTTQQTTELTCCVCSSTKPLDAFAKNQRKIPDQARCKDCVNRDLETELDFLPSSEGSEGFSEPDSDFDDWETPSVPAKSAPKKPTVAVASPAAKEKSHNLDDDFATLSFTDKKENENDWQLAGISRNTRNNSDSSASTKRSDVKKSGWAKVTKVPPSRAARWGEDAEKSNILEYPSAGHGKKKGAFNNRLVDLGDDNGHSN
ncbi:hypothetical protein L873DRAFT_1771828 [Choiromyces venosus 120613-1]|uniref:Stc1 domain-containing protein n=1 Tax=Choiromyces venosus 120613-1 TaxID=1336337 RepID=A0A3N4JL55_9PEZI|nr:hypothetical protein L873DRAFT_1771828 [Choiromyces venosus 120613-1]